MKISLLFIILLASAALPIVQQGYPTPPDAPGRLFYIQHSNGINTFVYDAHFSASRRLHDTDPVNIYRINYEKGGIKQELSGFQRRMAYGVEVNRLGSNNFEFTLAAYPHKKLQLKLTAEGKPYVLVNVNGKTLRLRKMFLFCNKSGTSVSHIDFYGKDMSAQSDLRERMVMR